MKKHHPIFEPVLGLPDRLANEARCNRLVIALCCVVAVLVAAPIGYLIALALSL